MQKRSIENALCEAGFLPPGHPAEGVWNVALGDQGDLLPGLLRAWQSAPARPERKGGPQPTGGVAGWLLEQCRCGARLTWGLPGIAPATLQSWIGMRLAWWPSGIPSGRPVGIISSRLGRSLDGQPAWFAVLRAACEQYATGGELLLSAGQTTTDKYVQRCAELFGGRLLRIETAGGGRSTLARWAARLRKLKPRPEVDPWVSSVFVSPAVTQAPPAGGTLPHELVDLPLRDRVLVAMSQQLIVLQVRRHGTVHRLIRARLGDISWPVGSVRVAVGQSFTDAKLAEELMSMGAIGWLVSKTGEEGTSVPSRIGCVLAERCSMDTVSSPIASSRPMIQLAVEANWQYLTHCTRRRDGPWPDQDQDAYLDDLILEREGRDHSSLSALMRIVNQRRLIASGGTIRGGTAVVSFTAVPLAELRQLRVFRPHRSRWDFQPYGICIGREWLARRGARPVRYADDRTWAELAPEERPFFQLQRSRGRRGAAMDWTVEQEWRHVGDLSLDELETGGAFLFVPSREEAAQLERNSPWPVVVVSD